MGQVGLLSWVRTLDPRHHPESVLGENRLAPRKKIKTRHMWLTTVFSGPSLVRDLSGTPLGASKALASTLETANGCGILRGAFCVYVTRWASGFPMIPQNARQARPSTRLQGKP